MYFDSKLSEDEIYYLVVFINFIRLHNWHQVYLVIVMNIVSKFQIIEKSFSNQNLCCEFCTGNVKGELLQKSNKL